jgi:hypothetical protein
MKQTKKLSSSRANTAKNLFIKSIKNKGIDISKVRVIKNTAKVNGPKYIGDYKNKANYKKYQYIKIQIH